MTRLILLGYENVSERYPNVQNLLRVHSI